MIVRNVDAGRYKRFRSGLVQLDEEGVVHVLRRPGIGDQEPILAAVGDLQFEVARYRLEHEFGCRVETAAARPGSPRGWSCGPHGAGRAATACRSWRIRAAGRWPCSGPPRPWPVCSIEHPESVVPIGIDASEADRFGH